MGLARIGHRRLAFGLLRWPPGTDATVVVAGVNQRWLTTNRVLLNHMLPLLMSADCLVEKYSSDADPDPNTAAAATTMVVAATTMVVTVTHTFPCPSPVFVAPERQREER